MKLIDSVTAFSTTPASYTITRELKTLGAAGLRAGFGRERFLVYAQAAAPGRTSSAASARPTG